MDKEIVSAITKRNVSEEIKSILCPSYCRPKCVIIPNKWEDCKKVAEVQSFIFQREQELITSLGKLTCISKGTWKDGINSAIELIKKRSIIKND